MNAEAATIGDNKPPEPIVTFKERADKYVAAAAKFATITEANEAQATDHLNLGTDLAGEIEAQRTAEKRPHLDANTRIDQTYKPVHETVETARIGIRTRLTAHAKAKKDAAEKHAREAAEKLRLAEEEAAKAAQQPEEEDPFLAATAAPAPDLDAIRTEAKVAELRTMTATRVSAASGGRTFAARKTPYSAEITDLAKLAAHFASVRHPDLIELLQKLASADARNTKGTSTLPGIKVVGGD